MRSLRSTDFGVTWAFVHTLLGPADGPSLGSNGRFVAGADLFTVGSIHYLVVTPTVPS